MVFSDYFIKIISLTLLYINELYTSFIAQYYFHTFAIFQENPNCTELF